jgi:hypothetical protein
MAQKFIMDKNYKLCQGCDKIWHDKAAYQCQLCQITTDLYEALQALKAAYQEVSGLPIGLTQCPMIPNPNYQGASNG